MAQKLNSPLKFNRNNLSSNNRFKSLWKLLKLNQQRKFRFNSLLLWTVPLLSSQSKFKSRHLLIWIPRILKILWTLITSGAYHTSKRKYQNFSRNRKHPWLKESALIQKLRNFGKIVCVERTTLKANAEVDRWQKINMQTCKRNNTLKTLNCLVISIKPKMSKKLKS